MGGREYWFVELDFSDKDRLTLEFSEIDWTVEATELHIDNGVPRAYVLLSRPTEEPSLRARIMDNPTRIKPS